MTVRQRRNLGRAVCFALALQNFSWAAWAQASPESDATARDLARSLADQGANAYAQEDYAHAQVLFARAYGLVPAPTIALLEARALVKLGRWIEATRTYRRASEAQLPAEALARITHSSLGDVEICCDLEHHVFNPGHTDTDVSEALRGTHWFDVREWATSGPGANGTSNAA